MKAHVGVDAKSKLMHHVVATSGAVADGKMLPHLLHGQETKVWGDSVYTGYTKVMEGHAPWAAVLTQRRGRATSTGARCSDINRKRSKARARAKHAIGAIKRIFGFVKVRYRGLAKNGHRQFVAAALANF